MNTLRISSALFRGTMHPSLAIVLGFLLYPCLAAGQQQPPKKVPRLTTDDVVSARTAPRTSEAEGEEGKRSPAESAAKQKEVDPEEEAWRVRVKTARDTSERLQRAAEEAELRVTALRNELNASGQTPRHRNEVAAEMDRAGQLVVELRRQAREAASELARVLEEGRGRGFAEAEGEKPSTPDGKPNIEYYKARHAELTGGVQAALRRMELYENRIRELNERINHPSVDRFTSAQLQQDRDEAQDSLNEARASLAKAQADLDALMEEARRAGVPPGTFR